jgi:glyoxylase-like metal-dependent hydrolase (beta-lactamase superfamily II)
VSAEAQAKLAELQQRDPAAFAAVRLVPPTLTFDGYCCIDGGDLTFELLPTPGHTPDHIAVFVPELRTLFAGDAAEIPFPFVGSAHTLPDLRASLKRMLQLAPTTVLYCHAPATYSADVIQANLDYFDILEQRCGLALASGNVHAPFDEEADLAACIGYGFTDVPGVAALNAEEREFYRSGHQSAIKAMLEYLQAPTPSGADAA